MTDEEMDRVAAACWPELQKWPEARHVTANNKDTYKPLYRMALTREDETGGFTSSTLRR